MDTENSNITIKDKDLEKFVLNISKSTAHCNMQEWNFHILRRINS